MDTSPNSATPEPRLSVSETGTGAEVQTSDSSHNSSVTVTVQDQGPRDSLSPVTPEQPQSLSLRAPTPSHTVEPGEEIEHAYWAEYEEDTSTPGEDELKEIDGADADYSACDRESNSSLVAVYQLCPKPLIPCQTHIGRLTSFGTWATPSMSPGRRPV